MFLQILGVIGFGILGGIFLFLIPFLLVKVMLILLFISIVFRRGFGRYRARRYYDDYHAYYGHRPFAGRRFRNRHFYGYAEGGPYDQQDFSNGRETLQDYRRNSSPISI